MPFFKEWASEEKPAAVSEGMIEEKAAIKALISDVHHFNLPSFVHDPGFCFLQLWCLIVSQLSGQHVLLTSGIQDTLSYKVLEKCATRKNYSK